MLSSIYLIIKSMAELVYGRTGLWPNHLESVLWQAGDIQGKGEGNENSPRFVNRVIVPWSKICLFNHLNFYKILVKLKLRYFTH
jgi:hypothetical protein